MSNELLQRLRMHGAVPGHIAIIMDGNGRWAKGRSYLVRSDIMQE
jgi:undecaprenyl diphosphate synthase